MYYPQFPHPELHTQTFFNVRKMNVGNLESAGNNHSCCHVIPDQRYPAALSERQPWSTYVLSNTEVTKHLEICLVWVRKWILIFFSCNKCKCSHMWLVATILDCAILDFWVAFSDIRGQIQISWQVELKRLPWPTPEFEPKLKEESS